MRLAVVTPLTPRASGVAHYSLDLLPYLAQEGDAEITLFTSATDDPPSEVKSRWTWRPVTDLPQVASEIDLIIYQMGNSPAHDFMAPSLSEYPGLVVLHDLSLHAFYVRQATLMRRPAVYMRAFGFAYGITGLRTARRHLREGTLVSYPDYLLSERIAARSPGVIVHSQYADHLLSERCPLARIWAVPMPMPLPKHVSSEEARARLSLTPSSYLVAVFGVINKSKNPEAVLDAVRRLRAADIPAQVVFIGRENTSFQLAPEIEQRGLQDAVLRPGFVDDLETVNLWLSAADTAVGLRSQYWGETSASALRILANGLPLITDDIGSFAELPDSACLKIPSTASDPSELLHDALVDLYHQPDRRRAMGTAAREYIAREHDPSQMAARYTAIIQTLLDVRRPDGK
jgi:glycosyltransferase involved in cell wall biosynthesis